MFIVLLSCFFTPHDNAERARAAVLREVEQLELDVRGPHSLTRRNVRVVGRARAGGWSHAARLK